MLKQIVFAVTATLALVFTIMKSLVMIKIKGSPIIELSGMSDNVKQMLGLESDQGLSIVLIDVIWLFFSLCLEWHYKD